MSRERHVVTVGETMALLDPLEDGEIRAGLRFELRIAGAESNFAVALARLGIPVAWISRLGRDPFGRVVAETLAREGLDLRWVRKEADAPTGVFFKWREGGKSSVVYYRRGSAAAGLRPHDVPDEALVDCALLHLTGITMALSEGARELVLDTARRARRRGIAVSFDPNYRPALWASVEEAAASQREVLPDVDWYLCGLDEGRVLFGAEGAEELERAVRAAGARHAVIRIGERGALVRGSSGLIPVAPARASAIRDEVGAGDGFAAGFAYGLLRGWPADECARAGNVVAAAALRGTGDWETYPFLADVERELGEGRGLPGRDQTPTEKGVASLPEASPGERSDGVDGDESGGNSPDAC